MGLKVLHLIDSGGLYGAEKMLLGLVEQQVRAGLEPVILSVGDPGVPEKSIETEAKRRELPLVPWRMESGLNLKASADLVAWAKGNGFEILHSHGYKFNILLGLLSRKRRALPFVTTIHGYTASKVFSKLFVYKTLDRILSFRPDRVVVVNAGLRKSLPSKRNVRFIPNGIEGEEADLQTIEEQLPSGRYIVVVGRLSIEKAVGRAIRAFSRVASRYPEYALVIVGDGPDNSKLELIAKDCGVFEKVRFTGYSHAAAAFIRSAVALLISSDSEGLPITLLEAMRARTPVVSTPVGEIPTVLGAGKFGYLASKTDEVSLADALSQLLDNSEMASKKAELAHRRFLEDYTSQTMHDRYLALYQEVVSP